MRSRGEGRGGAEGAPRPGPGRSVRWAWALYPRWAQDVPSLGELGACGLREGVRPGTAPSWRVSLSLPRGSLFSSRARVAMDAFTHAHAHAHMHTHAHSDNTPHRPLPPHLCSGRDPLLPSPSKPPPPPASFPPLARPPSSSLSSRPSDSRYLQVPSPLPEPSGPHSQGPCSQGAA